MVDIPSVSRIPSLLLSTLPWALGTSCRWLPWDRPVGGMPRCSEKRGEWGWNPSAPCPPVCLTWPGPSRRGRRSPHWVLVTAPPPGPSGLGGGGGSTVGNSWLPHHSLSASQSPPGSWSTLHCSTPLHDPMECAICFPLGPQLIEKVTRYVYCLWFIFPFRTYTPRGQGFCMLPSLPWHSTHMC